MRRFWPLVFLLLALLPWRVRAQSEVVLHLTPPQTGDFPRMVTYVQVWDAAGNFVSGLEARHFTVIEDGRYRGVDALEEAAPGVQFALAIQPGDTMRIRDAEGVTRWEYLQRFWQSWAAARPVGVDDFSLIAEGLEVTHRGDARALARALTDYTPDFAAPTSLTAFSRALEVVADPTPRPGMGRAVLLVTPPLPASAEVASGLQALAALARQNRVRVSVWMVAAPALADSPEADLLRGLSGATGGQFALISAVEDIPDPALWLEPLRRAYRLTYTARPAVGEEHTLQLWLHAPQGEATSESVTFALNVQPPNPAFVQPPLEIVRQPADRSRQALLDLSGYAPQQVTVEILIDFPDGQPRELKSVSLLLDGRVLARRTTPPFDRFVWDVSDIVRNEQHRLQLEAEDVTGLIGRSIEIPVKVSVVQPTESLPSLLYINAPRLALVAFLFVLVGVFLWLVFSGRLTPRRPFTEGVRISRPQRRAEMPRPVQPIRRLGARLRWPGRTPRPDAPAWLEQMEGAFVLPVAQGEVTLGSDPARAVLVLDDPSVSPLHARLRRDETGYWLQDAGSVAGTWVNYLPAIEETRLHNGDLVCLGRTVLRFRIADEPLPEPVILPLVVNTAHANR